MSGSDPQVQVDLTGQLLEGRYRVQRAIGRGGMGSVYLATDEKVRRRIVVKVPDVAFLEQPGFRERFAAEARSLLDLDHPHIVKVYDTGIQNGVPFVVLQYLAGGSLKDRLDRRPGKMAPADLLPWLRPVGEALDFIHQRRVIHRDVKPGNILFDEAGNAYLADFGIAKALGPEDPQITRTGMSPGSPAYVAPEAATPGQIGPAFDQYSLAVVVYQLLSGTLPHQGETPLEIYIRKTRDPPKPLRELAREVPKPVAAAVMKALSIDPADRYRTCSAFVRAFQAGIGTLPQLDPAEARGETEVRPGGLAATRSLAGSRYDGRRRGKLAGAAAAIAICAVGGTLWAVFGGSPDGAPDGASEGGRSVARSDDDGRAARIEMTNEPGRTTIDPKADDPQVQSDPGPDGPRIDEDSSAQASSETPAPPPLPTFELREPPADVATNALELEVAGLLGGGPPGALTVGIVGDRAREPLQPAADGTVATRIPLPVQDGSYTLEVRAERGGPLATRAVRIDRTKPRVKVAKLEAAGPVACEDALAIALELDEPATIFARAADRSLARLRELPVAGGVVELRPHPVTSVTPRDQQLVLVARDAVGNETTIPLTASLYSRAAQAQSDELGKARPDRAADWETLDDAARASAAAAWQASVEASGLDPADRAALLADTEWREPRPLPPDPRLPRDFVPDGTEVDPKSGLPSRLRHVPTGIELVLVPGGRFMLGAPADDRSAEPSERPAHEIELSPYYIGVTEVTNEQFRSAIRSHASGRYTLTRGSQPLDGPKQPVVNVSFAAVEKFCAKYGFVLPTEAQWERAARGDPSVTTPFPWGTSVSATPELNCKDRSLSALKIVPDPESFNDQAVVSCAVASYGKNALGLYDMHGNVEELCRDSIDKKVYSTRTTIETDPVVRIEGARHVVRGGGFESSLRRCRTTARGEVGDYGLPYVGFRVVLEPAR